MFMKYTKLFSVAVIACSLVACGANETKPAAVSAPASAASSLSANPDYKKGLGLVAKSNCLTCHQVDNKLVGPSYRSIADKYANESGAIAEKLAEKVVKGGVGVWGNVPMAAHPELSQEDALAMVKYVLLLKSN
jgi:cytochrome c